MRTNTLNAASRIVSDETQPVFRSVIRLLGVPIDNLTMAETLDRIEELVESGRAAGRSHQVATVNVDFLVKAHQDASVMAILQAADLATADGMPLVWASRLLEACALKERVAGADLVPLLSERAAQKGYTIYLYGSAPGIAERAARKLVSQYEGLKIVGCYAPAFSDALEIPPEVKAEILEKRPDILLVALGNPKQERWIAKHKNQLPIPVMIGIGGSLDFIAGTIRRAPRWMQQMSLEWLYRLIKEPRRLWKRYVTDLLVFGILFIRQWADTLTNKIVK